MVRDIKIISIIQLRYSMTMTINSCTVKSLQKMALWAIGALIVMNSVFAKENNAKTNTLEMGEMPVLQWAIIPTLYPDELLRFDPTKILEGIEVVVLPKPEPQKIVRQPAAVQTSVPKKKNSHNRYDPIIATAATRYQVDPAMVKAIILAESGYNPNAVSKTGARGLMQLMPATAKELGVKNSFNPDQNIHGGVKYFKKLLIRYRGNAELALAAYNAGPRKVKEYRGIPPFKATRYYIKKVLEDHLSLIHISEPTSRH